LTWNAPAQGNFTYNVYRDDNLLATIIGQNTYTDKGFNAATGHTWKVTVVCTSGESESVSVTKPVCNPCNPVANASATIIKCETAIIAWTSIEGSIGYKVSIDGSPLATLPGTATGITYTATFEHEKTYKWSIVTVCAYGESDPVEVTETANCVGISELANSIVIYPNPTTGELIVVSSEYRVQSIEMFDVMGKSVAGANNYSLQPSTPPLGISPLWGDQGGLSTLRLDISNLPDGMYFVRITTETGVVTRKVIKQ
jgi:hypothetical protein